MLTRILYSIFLLLATFLGFKCGQRFERLPTGSLVVVISHDPNLPNIAEWESVNENRIIAHYKDVKRAKKVMDAVREVLK